MQHFAQGGGEGRGRKKKDEEEGVHDRFVLSVA